MSALRVRLLLVHEDALERRAIVRFIQTEELPYDVVAVGTLAEAGSLLARRTFDLALLDQSLGDGVAVDLFPNLAGTPAVILMRPGDEAAAAQVVRAGAYGFVVRDPTRRYLTLLPPAISGALSRRRAEIAAARRGESLVRTQGEFQRLASMMWHEIMGPLTRLVATTEMLQVDAEASGSAGAADVRPLVKQTVETAIELERLVTDVLGYYRLQSAPALVTVDLDAVVQEVVAGLPGRLWHDAGVEIQALPSVIGDPTRLRLLFRQLLEGAHRRRTSERLVVRVLAVEYDDGVRVTVADNGAGLPPVEHDGMELGAGDPAGDDPGLGMAICRRIVEQHGGRLWSEMHEQTGATVYLTLPKATVPDLRVPAQTPA